MVNNSPDIMGKRSFEVEGPVTPSRLGELAIDPGIKNFRPAEVQKKALMQIASEEICKVFIAVSNEMIIGYVAFHRPHELTRWSSLPFILELGAIEISPDWRHQGVAKAMVQAAGSHGFMENHVMTSLEYAWHWDLKGTSLDIWSYQKMLSGLFKPVGFEIYPTDDPDILEHPASIFMARLGKNITGEQRSDFQNMLFLGEKRY